MLHRNLPLKAASILLAIFLWFWVMLNEENPITQKTVELRVTPQGAQTGLALELGTEGVKVSLRGLEQDMTDLKREVRATVSCRGLAAGTYRLAVKVDAPENLGVVAVRPESVPVVLENIVSESRPVEVKLVGEAIGGFDVKSADFSPRQVRVSGASSRVDRTAHVVVTADLARMVPGVPVPVPANAVDASGVPVDGVDLIPARVNVTAITERVIVAKTLPVVPRTHGALPSGLRLVSIQIDPPMVTLVLPATRAAEVMYVNTEDLNLNSVRGNVSRRVNLMVPVGASLADDGTARVTMKVEPIPPEPSRLPEQPREQPPG